MEIFLVFPIISILNLYELFEFFWRSMLSKYQQFVAILVLIWVVEYIFSWILFLYYQDFAVSDFVRRDPKVMNFTKYDEVLCSTSGECFLNLMDLGMRLGGGIGDVIPRSSFKFEKNHYFFSKIIIDMLFHILVNLILGNIFFGIIVDTFTDLRDENNKKSEDKNNKCLMCDRERYNNTGGVNFDHHRATEHKVFDYVYFICYLLRKNPQEYSRAEDHAWEQINMKKLEWYPGNINQDKENDQD